MKVHGNKLKEEDSKKVLMKVTIERWRHTMCEGEATTHFIRHFENHPNSRNKTHTNFDGDTNCPSHLHSQVQN